MHLWTELGSGLFVTGGPSDRFLKGEARYIDDLDPRGTTYLAFLRSPYAHAVIRKVDLEPVRRQPGVLLALDGPTVASKTRAIPPQARLPGASTFESRPLRYAYLADGKARYVGEPVAAIVATDEYAALDALESIQVEYERLLPVTDAEEALKVDAPRLHEEWPDNIYVAARLAAGDFEKAASEAELVLEETIRMHRQAPCPMEPRGSVAHFDPSTGHLVFYASSQNVWEMKVLLSYAVGIAPSSLRVVAPDIGGGFGLKSHLFPEDVVVALSSILLGRPVKWIESRRENLLCCHAREQTHHIRIAAQRDGRILGVRDKIIADLGATALYPHGGLASVFVSVLQMPGPYRIRNYDTEVLAVLTNKAPYGAYRGFGIPEAAFVLERMIDRLARELHLDPVEVRRNNLIRNDEFPYVSATGAIYDSGRFTDALQEAVDAIGYHEFRRMQALARKEGRLLGLGLGCYVRSSATATRALLPPDDAFIRSQQFPFDRTIADGARVTLDEDGTAKVFLAFSHLGTGVEEVYRSIAANELGVVPDKVQVVFGDTELCPEYSGVFASRDLVIGGAAVSNACKLLRDEILSTASRLVDAPIATLRLQSGKVSYGEPPREIAIGKIIASLNGQGLEKTAYYQRPQVELPDGKHVDATGVYSNGVDAAIVEVDPETLHVRILKYLIVHDTGTIIHEERASGQIIGGVVQGLGGCLLEEIVYDQDGQPLTTTLMDYALPSAGQVPPLQVRHLQTASTISLQGARSVGESGPAAVAAAVTAAVEDALSPLGVRITRTPLRPDYLFALTRSSGHHRSA